MRALVPGQTWVSRVPAGRGFPRFGREHRQSFQPEIIERAWQGTQQHESLLGRWNQTYAAIYGCMTSLQVTGELWRSMGEIACRNFSGGVVLDVGVGTGNITEQILRGSQVAVVGADWSEPFLRKAQRRLAVPVFKDRVSLWRVDLSQKPWPWPSASFDGAVSNYVLPYLPRSAQVNIVEEAYRVLLPGATFLVNFMRRGSSFRDIIRFNLRREFMANPAVLMAGLILIRPIFSKKADAARQAGLTYDFSDEEFTRLVRDIGYRKVELVAEGLPGPQGASVPVFRLVK